MILRVLISSEDFVLTAVSEVAYIDIKIFQTLCLYIFESNFMLSLQKISLQLLSKAQKFKRLYHK